ncbi:MAG: nitroreductase family protein [Pseudomonadota bacterium]
MPHDLPTNSNNSFVNDVDFSQRSPSSLTDPLFFERWSPRSFQKHSIKQDQLTAIFDAVRWSPSCYNEQPWQFYTSTEKSFDQFLNLLVEANQLWAKNTSIIGFITARQFFNKNGKPNAHADFDTGSAWMALALQAEKLGLHAHAMAGFDASQAKQFFKIDPIKERVICAFVIGKRAEPEKLPANLSAIEKPSARQALSEIWHIIE